MGERSQRGSQPESEESSCLLQRAVSVLQRSYLDSASQDNFQYSQAVLVENDVFLSELKAFAQAKEAAGYSQEELEETFAFLLFDNKEEVKEVCRAGLRVNSSSISMLGDPAKGVYISKYADCLHLRPWYHGKRGYIVICKLIKGKVKVVSGNYTTSYTCPSPGYDCHMMVSSDNVPSKTSYGQAFEQSQYYVYEVADGSAVERPRQICPYIVIACQYKERKEMPILAIENLPELDHKGLYCPWRGQLSIRGQLLCDISLRTPYSSTIPAQLPPNLDVNHVMDLSDLKKKLPKAVFGKRNYIENEVCFQGIYFSLYEVEISKKDQYKMDQLVENLKEKDLAIIKYLQDQGVLILLTSSALAQDDGFDPKEPISLLALFLFTSSRSVGLRAAEKHDPKDRREDGDISLKIASVLPGLRYALQKATSSSWDDASSASNQIKQHFQEYTKLGQHPQPISDQTNQDPLSALSPIEEKGPNPTQKCSEQTFSQLQRYLSDPSSYTLEVSSALASLTGAVRSPCCDPEADQKADTSPAVPPDPFPPNAGAEIEVKSENQESTMRPDQSEEEEPTQDVNGTSKLWVQPSRRKSSQAVVTSTRGKWSPLKMQMHPLGDSGRNRKATKKKKINITFSFPKKPALTASSNEPMLKLAHLQFPHRRKRGAEVLSAEFVHRTQSEPVKKETSAPNDPGVETKRLKTPKDPEMEKIPVTETISKPVKSKMLRSVASSPSKPQTIKQMESEWKEPCSVLPSKVSSQHHGRESQTSEIYPGGVADLSSNPKRIDYESHALNLLADLALASCIPSFLDSGMIPVSCSPSSDSAKEQQQSQHKNKYLRVASDHEYHKVDKLAKGATSPSKATPDQKLPPAEKPDSNDLTAVPRETNPGIFSRKNTLSPSLSKSQMLPPRETQEATEVNRHSFISAEHSYASQMPEHSKRHTYPRGTPYPGPATSRNGTRNAQAGPLVGKVLPFCRQQNSPHHQRLLEAVARRRRRSLLAPRLKEDFAKSHTVNVCGKSVKVTCRWDAEYLFNLDSRYTKDALEKTVIRALHGPWDPDLPDDVEEMKLILHMWVALFYSKPSKLLSSTRKVVEHSNPEKYVSINSSGDILELSDDGEDCFGLETCPADSRSDPDQLPSSSLDRSTRCEGSFHPEESPADSQTDADGSPGVVDSTVSSSSGELPCGEEEPSSTSCPESVSLAEGADESLVGKDRQTAVVPEDRDVSTITAEEPPKEGLLDTTTNSSPFDELGDASKPPAASGEENPSSQDPTSSTAPWNDAPRGCVEQQESGWAAAAGNGPGPPEDKENMRDAGHCMEFEDSSQATSDGPQCACDLMPLEAHPKSTKPGGASEEERESQSPEKEEGEVVEIEKEDAKYESPGPGAVDLAFSDSDANMEHELSEQEAANSAHPRDFSVPGEDPIPSPAALVSPGPDRSTSALPDGAKTGPQELPAEMAPSLDTLREPHKALATPNAETTRPGLTHAASPADVGSPRGCGSVLLLASDPSLVRRAQPESFPGSVGPAGETLGDSLEQKNKEGDGLEQKDKKRVPSAERWVLAGSEAAGTADLTSSPGSSSIHQTSLDGATDPAAPPEAQEAMESVGSPSQSDLPQRCGGNVCADLTLLSAGGSKQEGKKVSVEKECGSSSANRIDVLDESWGASDGQGIAFDCRALAGASEGGESDDVCLSAEKSPKSDKEGTVVAANATQEPETSLHHLLESKKSPRGDKAGTVMVANAAQEPETSLHHLLESEKSPKGDKADTVMVANATQEPETSLHHLLESEKSPKGDKTDTVMVANAAQEPESFLHHLLESEKSPKGDKADTVMVASATQEPETSLPHLLESKKSPRGNKASTVMVANAAQGPETSLHHLLESEKSPKSDKADTVMVANATQEPETSLHHHLESEPSSLVSEGMSAEKEHPKQQQSSPNGWSPPACVGLAPSSPPEQDLVPCGRDTDAHYLLLERSEQGTMSCQHVKPCELVAAEEVSVAAESPDGSLKPRCAEEVKKDTVPCHPKWAESSPVGVFVPKDLGSVPPPLHGHKAGLCSTEPGSGLGVHTEELSPGMSPAPDGSSHSCCMGTTCPRCASPEGQAGDVTGSRQEELILLEDLESRSSISLASPASFSPEETFVPLYKPQSWHEAEGSDTFADLHGASREVEERENSTFPFLMVPFHVHRGFPGENSELSVAEGASTVLPRAEQLPSRDRHMGLTFEDPFESFSGDSDQEYFGRTSQSQGSYSTRSMDAADTRTTCASSSTSSEHAEWGSEDWGSQGWTQAERHWPIGLGGASRGYVPPYVSFRDSQGFTKDYQNFVVTKMYREMMGKLQPSKRRSHCGGRSPLLRSLLGTWRGFEELTQHTLDMEYLRFHYKLKEILRSGKPPFSTSESIFPKDFSPRVMSEALPVREAPVPLSPRSRSPLQVTILPSATRQSRFSWCEDPCPPWHDTLCGERSGARSRTKSQGRTAPFHLSKLRYDNKLKDSQGDIGGILNEYAEFHRVMLSRVDVRSEGGGPVPVREEATSEKPCASLPGRMGAFEEMITELCDTLRSCLRSLTEEACGHVGMFYLVETGKDPFFSRVKTLLRKDGHMEVEPQSFCEVERPDTDRLLVVIRNEDISSHIHHIPCLLKLKHCPNVVFAGVDSPEDLTGHTYQELFHAGGFVVSDNELLETVTLGQLREVVKVLEKLNRSGRWKWLLHYKESKKLRGDSRVDTTARKKDLILKSCQGADLIEVLCYHACDAGSSSKSEYVRCLLELQVQHVSARFAVYLTEKPSASREVLESKGILVVDVNTFLGTMQKAAAPFRRSYW